MGKCNKAAVIWVCHNLL